MSDFIRDLVDAQRNDRTAEVVPRHSTATTPDPIRDMFDAQQEARNPIPIEELRARVEAAEQRVADSEAQAAEHERIRAESELLHAQNELQDTENAVLAARHAADRADYEAMMERHRNRSAGVTNLKPGAMPAEWVDGDTTGDWLADQVLLKKYGTI